MPQPYDLTSQYVSETYGRVVQIVSSSFYDGFGNPIQFNNTDITYTQEYVDISSTQTNYQYTILSGPPDFAEVFFNGNKLREGASYDFTRIDDLITFNSNHIFYTGDELAVNIVTFNTVEINYIIEYSDISSYTTNFTFILSEVPIYGPINVYYNGVHLRQGASRDYTISGTTVTFNSSIVLYSGDNVSFDYFYSV